MGQKDLMSSNTSWLAATPRWSGVEVSDRRIARPQNGIIVIACRADVSVRDYSVQGRHNKPGAILVWGSRFTSSQDRERV